jgi:hypothetical protein
MLDRFILPDWFEAQSHVKNELLCFWNKSYHELYEERYFNKNTLVQGELEQDILKLISFLIEEDCQKTVRKFMYFNWALCLAAKSHIDDFLNDLSEYQFILNELKKWEVDHGTFPKFANQSFCRQKNSNVVRESVVVFENITKIQNTDNPIVILSRSIDCCLQGSGICEGSIDKRAIFNWLLLDVFPSAYYCRLPSFIYTIKFDIENWTYYKNMGSQ